MGIGDCFHMWCCVIGEDCMMKGRGVLTLHREQYSWSLGYFVG
ncbi:hypothetical protein NC651_002551 [Populus alba x Populus x berolinensis]|nr:hypothetical protein NC651_002551 [Populus alba x Populus x berolinensis]